MLFLQRFAPAARLTEHVGEPIAVRQIAAQILQHARSARRAPGRSRSAFVATMSCQMSGGLEASRVVSARPRPGERQPVRPDGVADHLHQRARGELRQVAEKREQPVVRRRRSASAARRPERG